MGASSLTDEEFAYSEVAGLTGLDYTPAHYNGLMFILETREAISADRIRLRFFFQSKGSLLGGTELAKSEIFLGSGLMGSGPCR